MRRPFSLHRAPRWPCHRACLRRCAVTVPDLRQGELAHTAERIVSCYALRCSSYCHPRTATAAVCRQVWTRLRQDSHLLARRLHGVLALPAIHVRARVRVAVLLGQCRAAWRPARAGPAAWWPACPGTAARRTGGCPHLDIVVAVCARRGRLRLLCGASAFTCLGASLTLRYELEHERVSAAFASARMLPHAERSAQ